MRRSFHTPDLQRPPLATIRAFPQCHNEGRAPRRSCWTAFRMDQVMRHVGSRRVETRARRGVHQALRFPLHDQLRQTPRGIAGG